MRRLVVLLVLLAPLAGCLSPDTSEFFRERVEITRDDLDPAPVGTRTVTETFAVALEVEGYDELTAPVLDVLVKAIEQDPGFTITTYRFEGALAWRANQLRLLREVPKVPTERVVRLSLATDFSASAANAFIAFPGMIPFLPMSLGYGWEGTLDVSWRIRMGALETGAGRRVSVAFRELNARRSALFHVWPSTGFWGTQFVAGLVLAPTFWFYDDEDTTPLLVKALEPRLGATIAVALHRDLVATRGSR